MRDLRDAGYFGPYGEFTYEFPGENRLIHFHAHTCQIMAALEVVQVTGDAEPASEPVRLFLFESVRELLLNAAKYSGAREAHVTLMRTPEGWTKVIVMDEGQGFDAEAMKPSTLLSRVAPCAPVIRMAPTTEMAEIALVSDINGVCKAGVTLHTT